MSDNDENVLPCPFCGDDKPLVGSTLDSGHYVFCSRDACFGGCSYTETRAEAITAWNTRATPTPPIEGLDADVELIDRMAKAIADADPNGMTWDTYNWGGFQQWREAKRGQARAALQALGER